MHTCIVNIKNIFSKAWETREDTGTICVDFFKAFDSKEHTAMEFFNFREYRVGRVCMYNLEG
jgi:hypothetical protein